MMIFLIVPPQGHIYGELKAPLQMHMGLAYIAAVLENNGFGVRMIDMDAEHYTRESLLKKILAEKADIAGITVTTPTLKHSLSIARMVKESSPLTYTVFGGMHPSVMPDETISDPYVDFVIKGEGELTFLELAAALNNGKRFSSIDGLLFKENGKAVRNKERALIDDLDTLPFPARRLFNNKRYTYPDSLCARTAPMITSRGCPGRCTYCNASSIFGRRFRARSARNVADEVELLIRDFGIQEIHTWDDNFATDRGRVYEIRDEIKRRNIKMRFAFPNGIRADFLNKDILRALKDMGTYSISIGVESGSQDVLDKAKKGVRLNKVVELFDMAKDMGLERWAFFMFGLPGETKETACETIEFAKRLDADILKFHVLKPYPGTEVFQYMLDNKLLNSLDYDNYGIHTPPVHHLDGLTEEDLLHFQRLAYREFYFRPTQFLKQLLRIKSLNRLKLNLQTAWDLTKIAFKG